MVSILGHFICELGDHALGFLFWLSFEVGRQQTQPNAGGGALHAGRFPCVVSDFSTITLDDLPSFQMESGGGTTVG